MQGNLLVRHPLSTALLALILPLTLASLNPATAAPARNTGIEQLVVTGVHQSEPIQHTTASVSVLQRDTISRLHKSTAVDLLRTQPGLLINQQGGMGGVSELSLRGSESNFVTVLLDGVIINDPSNSRGGSVNLHSIAPESIERIEVVRGPHSSVYGSGSLAGAVHILTRQPTDEWQQAVRLEGGEYGYHQTGYRLSGGSESVAIALSANSLDSGEPTGFSRYQSDNLSSRLQWQINQRHALTLAGRYLEEERQSLPEQSGGPRYALSHEQEDGEAREYSVQLAWQAQWADFWQSDLSVSQFERSNRVDSPGIVPWTSVPPTLDDSDYRQQHWRWINTLGDTDQLWLYLGADYRREKGHSEGYLDFGNFGFPMPTDYQLERDTRGVFATLNWLAPGDWLLQASVRNDDPDTADNEDTWQLGFRSPQFAQQLTLRGNWGQAFKLPSFFALGHPLVGNPDLQPETSEGWELSLDWQLSEVQTLSLTGFRTDYEDLVDFDPDRFTNVNRSSVRTSGAELSWHWQPVHGRWQLLADATYTDIDVKDNAAKLNGRPQLVAGVVLTNTLSQRLSSSVDLRWYDQRYATSLHTGNSVTEELDSYLRTDLALQWQVTPQLETFVRLENLLDESYEEAVGFEAPGRQLRVGGSLQF